jgi:hypothetical protein
VRLEKSGEAGQDLTNWQQKVASTLQAAPTRLITRLILEHADKSRIASMAEAGHDH